MSDMGQQAPPMGPQKPMMEQLRSPMNPSDVLMTAKRGELPDTFGAYMEKMYGIKWDDPLQVAGNKLQQKMQMAKPENKAMAMAGAPGGAPGGGPQGPPQGPPPRQSSGSPISDMMGKYGG